MSIKDKIVNNEIHLDNGEAVGLEEYRDRITDPYRVEILELQEETKSLWWMLDEIKKSQTWTKEHTEELQKSIDKQMLTLKLMQMRRGEA